MDAIVELDTGSGAVRKSLIRRDVEHVEVANVVLPRVVLLRSFLRCFWHLFSR